MNCDSERIYSWIKDLPIIDWHNHLDPAMLAADAPLGSLYEVWVKADPYKHRAMRICGEREELITGNVGERTLLSVQGDEGTDRSVRSPMGDEGTDKSVRSPGVEDGTDRSVRSPMGDESEKWTAWMRTLPKLVGNPLFAWAKMELEFLGLDPEPYLHGRGENVSLADWTPSKLLAKFNVEAVCPCVTTLGERTLLSVHHCVSSPFREFPAAMANPSPHFCTTLFGGEGHVRNLPHVAHDGALVFLTFRLADSLPSHLLRQYAEEKMDWLESHPKPWSDETETEYAREFDDRINRWLDSGSGSCLLRDPECWQIVVDTLEKFNDPGDGSGRYVLHSYVVMANHVHVLFELKDRETLASVVQGWKGASARRINQLRGSQGKVWQEEYFDRLIRDAEHYKRTIAYIRSNAKANGQECPFSEDEQMNGQECPFSEDEQMNGQECPFSEGDGMRRTDTLVRSQRHGRTDTLVRSQFSVIPSLRMNAGDVISEEALCRFQAAGCCVVDISVDDTALLETAFESLSYVAAFAAAHGWTMLLHLGALRETSARLRAAAGPAGGFAGMRAPAEPADVARFLDRLEHGERTLLSVRGEDGTDRSVRSPMGGVGTDRSVRSPSNLPRTILLSLNPEAHAQLAILSGSFVGAGMPGKVQLGPAWWWCDHREGIVDVLEKSAAYGVLSTFVGMTTDSRSLLSFVRHDYFRRILSRWLADKVASGEFPDDESLLRPLCENLAYRNAHDHVVTQKGNL